MILDSGTFLDQERSHTTTHLVVLVLLVVRCCSKKPKALSF